VLADFADRSGGANLAEMWSDADEVLEPMA